MKKHCVDLSVTGQFSSFFLDYISGKETLRPFYTHHPTLESFRDAIEAKSFSEENRRVLQLVLQKQYSHLDKGERVEANISALSQSNTFTVTTGHQLNLFTGPLYFIYKIVSTINLAKKLSQAYPNHNFVPVYWMATEDHDFEEINYFKLDGIKYEWTTNQSGAVGEFELDASFRDFLKAVSFAPAIFKEAYLQSKNLAEAVRKYVHSLFGEEGLVVLDANDPDLKRLFSKVIESDLVAHHPFHEAQSTTNQLEELGYKSQIFPREINFFYLDQGIRDRIERKGNSYQVVNQDLSFTEDEIKKMIQDHPERFSPNVVLRPLYQEMILPNLAYLGGPAEVVYWLQLKGVFDHFQISFPILLPRNFALILDEPISLKMEKAGFGVEDLFLSFETWKKNYIAQEAMVDLELKEEREALAKIFDSAGKKAFQLESSLNQSFEAGKIRCLKILDQMGKKLRKAEEKRNQVALDRAKQILDYAAPGGTPQERTVNMMQFYLSDPEFIQKLLANFDPLEYKMMVLAY